MLTRSLIKYIGGVFSLLMALTACGGGGSDMNFSIESNNNWPWPWETNADFFAQKTFSQEIMVVDQLSLRLDVINGEVNIIGHSGVDSVIITAEAQVGSYSLLDAQTGLNQLEVKINDMNGEIFIQTLQPSNLSGRQYLVDYTLTIPSDLSVKVKLVNGHISIADVEEPIIVDLENGHVNLKGVNGDATVNVSNGGVDGSISFLPIGEIDISTVNGNIDLGIPTSASAELFLQVDNGIINWNNLNLIDAQYTNQSLQGILGQGSGLIELETVNGDIELTGTNI